MSDLQTATDIVALAFMGFITLVILAVVTGLLLLKRKVTKTKKDMQRKMAILRNLPVIGKEVFTAALRAAKHG